MLPHISAWRNEPSLRGTNPKSADPNALVQYVRVGGSGLIMAAEIGSSMNKGFNIAMLSGGSSICWKEDTNDDKREFSENRGDRSWQHPRCSKRLGTGSRDGRGNVCIGFFRESGKGPLQSGKLCSFDQLLH